MGIIHQHLELLLKHLAALLLVSQGVQGSQLIQLHGLVGIASELLLQIFVSSPLLLR